MAIAAEERLGHNGHLCSGNLKGRRRAMEF
jgi:hypothetical protein